MLVKVFKWGLVALVIAAGAAVVLWAAMYGLVAFEHWRIAGQGEILHVLPDTKQLGDDTWVLFFRDKALYAIRLNGEAERRLYEDVSAYHWSPDGSKLVLRTIQQDKAVDIVLLDVASGQAEVIERQVQAGLPDWSPDGKHLAYIVADTQAVLYDVAAASKVRIAEAPSDIIVGVKWSTDGGKLFYNTLFAKDYVQYHVSTGKRSLLSGQPGQPAKVDWPDLVAMDEIFFNQFNDRMSGHYGRTSPNGRYRVDNQDGSLWIETPQGTELLVTFQGIWNVDFGQPGITEPEWLPNNQVVLFNFRDKVYAVDIETKQVGLLTEGEHPMAYLPQFRPADLDQGRQAIMYDDHIHMRDR